MEDIKPNFIGIGVQKGGTSWLHKQFINHPEIFVPEHRKEIHFFDEYYDRDLEWYLKWFHGANHKAIGEITPNYIYDDRVCDRIKEYFPDMRFIVMLRHPVERAYSHYQMTFQSGEGQKYQGFDDFMENHAHGLKRGLYGKQLQQWFRNFSPEQFLILASEEIFSDEGGVEKTFGSIGSFLNVDPNLFDRTIAKERVGKARIAPSNGNIAKSAQKVRLFLRDHDLDFIATAFKKIGITRQLFGGKENAIPPLTSEQKERWIGIYQEDIKLLESLLGRSFAHWA